MTYTFTHILAFFMFYAFAGWCTEVIYKTTQTGKFVNRGFLNGPLCPIYGVGVIIVILCLTPLQDNLLLLYIGSFLLTSALEFVTGFVLEKVFHQKWWDYTEDPFNIMGYVCLGFSLIWGLACVFVMKIVQPIVLDVIAKIPHTVQTVIFIVFYGLMAADLIITVAALAKVKKQMRLANDLDHMLNRIAEAVGTRLSSGTIKGMNEFAEIKEKAGEKAEETKEQLAEAKEQFSEARARYAEKADAKLEKYSERAEERKEKYSALTAANKEKLAELRSSINIKSFEARYREMVEATRAKFGENSTGTERLSAVHRRLQKAYPNLKFENIENNAMSGKLEALKEKLETLTENIGNAKL